MAFPEDFEEIGEADLLRVEDDPDHLGVSGPACRARRKQTSDQLTAAPRGGKTSEDLESI